MHTFGILDHDVSLDTFMTSSDSQFSRGWKTGTESAWMLDGATMAFGGVKLGGEILKSPNFIVKAIENNKIEGKIILSADKIKDPIYFGGDWLKKAFYSKNLGKDFHWMENVKTGERTQIKVK